MEYIPELVFSYQDFLDRRLPLTRKLLNQGSLVVKLKPSLRKFYGRLNDLDNGPNDDSYVPFVVITIRSFPHSWLITRVREKSNTANVTRGAGTTYPSVAPGFTHGFYGVRTSRSLVFSVLFCRSLFVLLSFFLWQLNCLPFDFYSFWLLIGIFKLFLNF